MKSSRRYRVLHALNGTRTGFYVLSLILCLIPGVAAQTPTGDWPRNGNWDAAVWASGATGYERHQSFSDGQVWMAGVRLSRVLTDEIGPRWFRGNLEYGFDLVPVLVASKPQTIYGAGFDPIVLRYNFHRRRRFALYLEFAGGGFLTAGNFPPGNTSTFNFAPKAGSGIQLRTGHRQALDIGLRYCHYSNAELGTRNPAFNGLQVVIGYHWFR